jgi:cell division inhibitor SepF
MSMFAKVKDWFSIQDEGEEEFYAADEVGAKRNVVPLSDASRRANAGGSVAVFAPRSFADVTVQGADRNLLQRVVDFTSGVAYTIDGRIQKLAEAIYLVVPSGVSVNSAGVKEQLDNDGLLGIKDFR